MRKRDGSLLTYQYDALGRMTAKFVPERPTGPYPLNPSQTRDVYYSYDLRNLQLTARFDSPTGEGITNAYDGFGRLSSSTSNMGGVTRTLSYAYNAHGARTRITHPDGYFFATLLDGFDRPYYAYDSAYAPIAYYTYTPFGTLDHSGHGAWTFYGHDGVQRPNLRYHDFHGGAGSVLWTYGYNPAGGLGSVTRDNDAFAWTRHYAVNRTYAADGLNRYSAVGAVTPTYDTRGNMPSAGSTTYSFTADNRMATAGSSTMIHNAAGELEGIAGSDQYHYDAGSGALIAEHDWSSGAIRRRYVFGPGIDEPLVWYEGTGTSTRRYHHADERGSVIAVSGDSAAAYSVNRYDEYGIPGAGNTGRFQYTGQAWLPQAGMYYYRARMYSPTHGRFMQTDPIGFAGGMNIYGYVGNDPVNSTDPSGLADPDKPPVHCVGDYCAGGMGGQTITVTGRREPRVRLPLMIPAPTSGFGGSDPSGERTPEDEDLPDCGTPGADTFQCTAVVHGEPIVQRATFYFRRLPPISFPGGRGDACGSAGTGALVPDHAPGGIDIAGVCVRHDFCYGSSISRIQCDRDLRDGIWDECVRHRSTNLGCYAASIAYYRAVRRLGTRLYRGSGDPY